MNTTRKTPREAMASVRGVTLGESQLFRLLLLLCLLRVCVLLRLSTKIPDPETKMKRADFMQ
jgi:hypothetical protein